MSISITTINASDLVSDSRETINDNFDALKVAVEDLEVSGGTSIAAPYASYTGDDYFSPHFSVITKPLALSGNWTVTQNGGTGTPLTVTQHASGCLVAKLYGSDGTGRSLRRDITVTGDFRFSVGLSGIMREGDYSRVGLYIKDTGTGKLETAGIIADGTNRIMRERWTNVASWSAYESALMGVSLQPGTTFFLQVERSGSTIYYRFSLNPDIGWIDIHSNAAADWVATPSETGVFFYGNAGGSAFNSAYTVFHWAEENDI